MPELKVLKAYHQGRRGIRVILSMSTEGIVRTMTVPNEPRIVARMAKLIISTAIIIMHKGPQM